jgi:chromate transporter
VPGTAGQLAAIGLGALVGRWALPPGAARAGEPGPSPVSQRTGAVLLGVFAVLLVALPALAAATGSAAWQAVDVVYRAGALVFGGGHVVLPLLQAGVVPPGWVGADAFLAGYGAAQAVPGPLFSFAAYLGALMPAPLGGWAGGLAMLGVIFLPAFLLVAGALPFWAVVRQRPAARQTMAGVNAAVVGVLGGALLGPVGQGAITSAADLALVGLALGLLLWGKVPTIAVLALIAGLAQWMGGFVAG